MDVKRTNPYSMKPRQTPQNKCGQQITAFRAKSIFIFFFFFKNVFPITIFTFFSPFCYPLFDTVPLLLFILVLGKVCGVGATVWIRVAMFDDTDVVYKPAW